MKAHSLFFAFLIALALLVPLAIGLRGCDYYRTPLGERPFHPQYERLKPSGIESHGYGIIGSLLIFTGVVLYSSRKRLRFLRGAGPISVYLQFHIAVCLLGPVLVLYHTTFKFGGLVAVSVWSMLAVVFSGVIGRYLYRQIPRSLQGHEMTQAEMDHESAQMRATLLSTSGMPPETLDQLDALVLSRESGGGRGFLAYLRQVVTFDLRTRWRVNLYRGELRRWGVRSSDQHMLVQLALRRSALRSRMIALEHSRRIFHLWHVIHLPFATIMFVIVLVHVGVAVALGYWWIW